MKSTWKDISEIIEQSDKEVIITFREEKSSSMKGLAIISIKGPNAKIIHLSTHKKADFGDACKKVSDYVNNNSVITSVVFPIFHIPQEVDGQMKMKMDPFFGVEMKKANFKWKCLENMKDGKRATVYKYKGSTEDAKQDEVPHRSQVRLNTAKIQSSKIKFSHLLVLSDNVPEFDHLKKGKPSHSL